MITATTSLLGLLVFALLCHEGSAISCYNCTSNDLYPNKECVGPSISKKYEIECPQDEKYCLVQKTTSTIFNLRSTQTTRGCYDIAIQRCIQAEQVESCFDTCTEDLCNKTSAAKRVIPTINVVLSILAALYAQRLQIRS